MADLERVRVWAEALIRLHLDDGWTFGFDRAAKRAGHPKVSRAIHITFGIQILLGIGTVMTGVRIEVAALHQLVGALLVIAATWGAHATGRR